MDTRTYVFTRGPGFDVLVAISNSFGGDSDRAGYSVDVNLGPNAPFGAAYYNAYDRSDTFVVTDQTVAVEFEDGLPPKLYVRITI